LTPAQCHVTREHGTERAFTGPFRDGKCAGTYGCVIVRPRRQVRFRHRLAELFAPVNGVAVSERADGSFFMRRTEVRCAAGDAHLGHVFPDGPQPTGLRDYINATAINFTERTAEN
jgi:peptide-methionine (R)-S-oxide reductase